MTFSWENKKKQQQPNISTCISLLKKKEGREGVGDVIIAQNN